MGENIIDGDEFCVTSSIVGAVCGVHAPADDRPIVNEDTAYRSLVCGEGKFSLFDVSVPRLLLGGVWVYGRVPWLELPS